MKEFVYIGIMVIMLTMLAGFISTSTPTSAFVANLPPQWRFITDELSGSSMVNVDLKEMFFDPDGDALSFAIRPEEGVSAYLNGDVLSAKGVGFLIVSASDGKAVVSKRLTISTR